MEQHSERYSNKFGNEKVTFSSHGLFKIFVFCNKATNILHLVKDENGVSVRQTGKKDSG